MKNKMKKNKANFRILMLTVTLFVFSTSFAMAWPSNWGCRCVRFVLFNYEIAEYCYGNCGDGGGWQ